MHCRTCDYPLWNLTTRTCPECGTSFRPSEFEFAINAVRFCCPHCDTAYYGTTSLGHLQPSEFTCVKCHRPLYMDQMVLRPAEWLDEHGTTPNRVPWLHRRTIGGFRAWWNTCMMAMTAPQRLMRGLPLDSSVAQAWWFASLTHLIIILVVLVPLWGCIGTVMATAPQGRGGGGVATLVSIVGVQLAVVAMCWIVGLAIWGAVAHAALRLTGTTRHSIGRTYQALCYAGGANIISAIPCVGGNIGPIWWIVSAILCTKEAQRVSGGRATFAVLLGPVAFIVLITLAYFGLIAWAVTSSNTFSGFNPGQVQTNEVQAVSAALLGHATSHNGAFPGHASQLIIDGFISGYEVLATSTATGGLSTTVGDQTLDDFLLLPENRQRMAAQAAADALPASVIAHRLGDFVFTFHGMDTNTCDPKLWILIASPDPAANPWLYAPGAGNPPSSAAVTVAQLDGSVRSIPARRFATELAGQNRLRAIEGLAPLPDHATVTHESPAVATQSPPPQTPGSRGEG